MRIFWNGRDVLTLLAAVSFSLLLSMSGVGQDFQANGLSGALIYKPSDGTAYSALPPLNNGNVTYVYELFSSNFDTLRAGYFYGTRRADMVVYNSHTALAYIGLGNGDGTFAFQSLFWSPGYDIVECGDIDGDGKTDVALYNSSTGTLYTGISNGGGGFTYKYTLISRYYTFVRLADFTGDGKADLFLYNSNNGQAFLGVGNGDGTFTFNPLFISAGYTLADIGDLNGDGKMDLILYNPTSGNAATGISNGASGPTFNGFNFTPLIFTPGFTSVRLADYTGDGLADATVYNQYNGLAYFLTGTGTGTFTSQSLFWSPGYDSVVAEDVDGDGRTDVILYNSSTGTEYTGVSNGSGAFTYTYKFWGGGYVQARSVPPRTAALPSSTTLIPFGWVSPAETLMFTGEAATPQWFSVVIENDGVYSQENHVDANRACYVLYLAPTLFNGPNGDLSLWSDQWSPNGGVGTWVAPGARMPGTSGQVSNSQCTLDIGRSWVQVTPNSGQMQLQLALTFSPNWSGKKEIFVDVCCGLDGNQLDWTNRGSWTVPNYSRVPVTTDHYDVFRTGATVHENLLTPSNAPQVQLLGQIPVTDGCVWAQPLYVPNVTIQGGPYNGQTHNVLYVATSNANVHAYDADAAWDPNPSNPLYGKDLWPTPSGSPPTGPTNLGTPPGPRDDDIFLCQATEPGGGQAPRGNAGIVGTPVIDLSSSPNAIMYVAANLNIGGNTQHQLFGLDITTGATTMGPATVQDPNPQDPSNAFQPNQELQRAGLLLADYNVLVPYGSYKDNVNCSVATDPITGDCPGAFLGYQGWMFSFDRGNLGMLDYANYSPNSNAPYSTFIPGATIWQSGGGPAFDGSRVYFATGNNKDGSAGSAPIYLNGPVGFPVGLSNSLLQVNPYGSHSGGPLPTGLAQVGPNNGQFSPALQPSWVRTDQDLGSSRAILVPGTNDAIAAGKSGQLYVADRTFPLSGDTNGYMGGGSSVFIYGGFAAWNKSAYIWGGNNSALRSFSLNGALQATGGVQSVDLEMGAVVSISSCYDQNGLVWTVRLDSDVHQYAMGDLIVYNAYDPNHPAQCPSPGSTGCSLGAPLKQMTLFNTSGQPANAMKFTPPLVVNGRVYVVSMSQEILVYGIPGQSGQTAPACVGTPPH